RRQRNGTWPRKKIASTRKVLSPDRVFPRTNNRAAWLPPATAARFVFLRKFSGFFQQTRNPNQDHRTDESGDKRTDDSATEADVEQAEYPPADHSPENAEDDVDDHAVAPAFHDLSCQPTCDQTHSDPVDKAMHWQNLLGSERKQSAGC